MCASVCEKGYDSKTTSISSSLPGRDPETGEEGERAAGDRQPAAPVPVPSPRPGLEHTSGVFLEAADCEDSPEGGLPPPQTLPPPRKSQE